MHDLLGEGRKVDVIRRVVEDANGTPLDIGRRRRTIPTALRRALRYRDRG